MPPQPPSTSGTAISSNLCLFRGMQQSMEAPDQEDRRSSVHHFTTSAGAANEQGLSRSVFAWMNCAALSASAQRLVRVKPLEERRKIAHDALQLHLDAVQEMVALLAIPLEPVHDALRPGALDHQADAAPFGALRRMAQVRRHEEDRAFFQLDASRLAAFHDVEKGVAFHLVEEFLVGIVVEVGAPVGPADDGDDEIRVRPDLRVADRGLQQMPVLVDPFLEIERLGARRGGAHSLMQMLVGSE